MVRRTIPVIVASVAGLCHGTMTATAQSNEPAQTGPNFTVDLTTYHLMSNYGVDPAFGFISPITGIGVNSFYSHSIAEQLTELDGAGVRVSARTHFGSSWFGGALYTGFFTDAGSSIGDSAVDTDNVHANLLDRTLADNVGIGALNTNFDNGLVDFASESIDMEQHFGDLVVGRQLDAEGPLSGFWHAGLRVANTDLDREVVYQNLEFGTDLDTAQIDFSSHMWGVGPTLGGGLDVALSHGFSLAASASASLLYANFDISRRDAYFDQSQPSTEIRQVSLQTQDIVPVFDATVELNRRFGRFNASLGYTMSTWLGGGRSIATNGFDNNDDRTTTYTVNSDNIITHGVFARVSTAFGALPVEQERVILESGSAGVEFDLTAYHLMSNYGVDPAFGFISPITGIGIHTNSHSIAEQLTELNGGGVRVSARRHFGSSWFGGALYTGFFTDVGSTIGDITTNTDNVHANLLDRTLASNTILNGDFDDGEVDFASDSIEMDQHFGDLVVGRQLDAEGPFSGFWHAGLRVANTDLDRHVVYQNLEFGPDLDTAQIDFSSHMWGVGPTLGGGLDVALPHGFSLAASASASLLYANFDLARRDAYFDQSDNETEIRQVSLQTQDIVPVFDATVELNRRFGRFNASLGYTMSAWLGGGRSIATNGWDDNLNRTTPYTIDSDNIVTHGVFAQVGMQLGEVTDEGEVPEFGLEPGGLTIDMTGYYLMTQYGADAAFGPINPVAGFFSESISVAHSLFDPDGGGVRVSARRHFGSSWFGGALYTGFFTDAGSTIGDSAVDTDNVHANLLDRALADNAGLNGLFDSGMVDFASDSFNMQQHFGDLVVGRQLDAERPFSGFWHAGLRVANTDLDREVVYQNLEVANLDTAQIDFSSHMWGVGPTLGGGLDVALPHGFSLAASASASLLYANFDISRRDAYTEQLIIGTDTEIRQVSLQTQDIVPVFDAAFDLSKSFGRFNASLGYTMSAWLGGARSINVNGWDDTDDDTTSYTVDSGNILTHGVFARVGVAL